VFIIALGAYAVVLGGGGAWGEAGGGDLWYGSRIYCSIGQGAGGTRVRTMDDGTFLCPSRVVVVWWLCAARA